MRRIVQITTGSVEDRNGQPQYTLIALCDDGTVWGLEAGYTDWFQYPAIQ